MDSTLFIIIKYNSKKIKTIYKLTFYKSLDSQRAGDFQATSQAARIHWSRGKKREQFPNKRPSQIN